MVGRGNERDRPARIGCPSVFRTAPDSPRASSAVAALEADVAGGSAPELFFPLSSHLVCLRWAENRSPVPMGLWHIFLAEIVCRSIPLRAPKSALLIISLRPTRAYFDLKQHECTGAGERCRITVTASGVEWGSARRKRVFDS